MGPLAVAAQVFAAMALTTHAPHHAVVARVGDHWQKVCVCGRQRIWVSCSHDTLAAAEFDPCEHQMADERTAGRLKFCGTQILAALGTEEAGGTR